MPAVPEEAIEIARRIADNAPISARQAKHSTHCGLQMDLASGLMFEIEDPREGNRQLQRKRKLVFKGR